jgi:hypothetical protein
MSALNPTEAISLFLDGARAAAPPTNIAIEGAPLQRPAGRNGVLR